MKFKKVLAGIVAAVVAVACLPNVTFAETITSGDFVFDELDDGTLVVIDYTGEGGAVVIPSTVNGKEVTQIGNNWINYDWGSITSIEIPASVIKLSPSTIFNQFFTSLASIIVDEDNPSFTSENGVLFNKDMTEIISYPIEKKDTEYTIPDGVRTIGNYAFMYNTYITSITIPASVVFEDNTFNPIDSFTTFSTFNYSFNYCTSLTAFIVDEDNQSFSSEDGVLFDKDKTEIVRYPMGKKASEYNIPEGVKAIAEYAFAYNTSLTSITIPDSVEEIYSNAFSNCTSLTSIDLPDSVSKLGSFDAKGGSSLHRVFTGCSSLSAINVSERNQTFSSDGGVLLYHYNYNDKDETVLEIYPDGKKDADYIVPDGVTKMGWYLFNSNVFLTSITISESVTEINADFGGCPSLSSINVVEGNQAFSSVDGVLFNKGMTTLRTYPAGRKDPEYIIPDTVTGLNSDVFRNNEFLTSVVIPESVTTTYANFSGCTSLTSVTFLGNETKIGLGGKFGSENLTIYGYVGSSVEEYAKTYKMNFVPLTVPLKENETGIAIEGPLPYGTSMSVVKGEETETSLAFDITLEDVNGDPVTHVGEVTVTIPIPEELADAENYYVYYQNGSSFEDMEAYHDEENNCVTFTTTHFSTYILSTAVLSGENTDQPGGGDSTGGGSNTGDPTGGDTTTTTTTTEAATTEPETTTTTAPAASDSSGGDNVPNTGAALLIIPVITAAAAAVISKKRR